jgi:PAS domain-containing protein
MHAATRKAQPKVLPDVDGPCRQAIETLPAAIYMTDAEGRITFYNESAAELWGRRPKLGRQQVLRFLEALLAGWHAAPA